MNMTTIQKWGNSYAVRLPNATIRKFNLKTGHSVEIRETAKGRAFSIVPVRLRTPSFKEMVTRITKANRHALANWASAVGRESW